MSTLGNHGNEASQRRSKTATHIAFDNTADSSNVLPFSAAVAFSVREPEDTTFLSRNIAVITIHRSTKDHVPGWKKSVTLLSTASESDKLVEHTHKNTARFLKAL
ncbi:hypothetical protein Q7P35_012105 [Cladosporium inversicolor]